MDEAKAREVFKDLHSKLPYNTNKAFLQVKTRDCTLYIPAKFSTEKEQKIEKENWQTLVYYAKF